MSFLISAALIVVGVIHLLPLAGAFGRGRLQALYDVKCDDPNLEILMRHRAVSIGLYGALALLAAFRPELQELAIVAGLVTVLSFVWFVWSSGGCNTKVIRVVKADLVALAGLAVAAAARWFETFVG